MVWLQAADHLLPSCSDAADNAERQGGVGWQTGQSDARALQIGDSHVPSRWTNCRTRYAGTSY